MRLEFIGESLICYFVSSQQNGSFHTICIFELGADYSHSPTWFIEKYGWKFSGCVSTNEDLVSKRYYHMPITIDKECHSTRSVVASI